MKQNSKKRKQLITLLVALSAVLALLVAVAVYMGMRDGTQDPSGETAGMTTPTDTGDQQHNGETVPDGTYATENAPGETQPVDDVIIFTEFCQLNFPGQWKDMLKTEYTKSAAGGAVDFTGVVEGKSETLFRIVFSRSAEIDGIPVGVLKVNGEYILLCVQMNETESENTWSEEGYNIISEMREDVNYLLQKLRENPDFSADTSLLSTDPKQEYMQIDTPYVKLVYPGKWQGKVKAEYTAANQGGSVTFTGEIGGEKLVLFVVYFGNTAEGTDPLGYIQKNGEYVQVSVRMYEPDDESAWTPDEQDTFAAMQEGVNDLTEALMKDRNFTKDPDATPVPDTTEQPSDGEQTQALPYEEPWIPSRWKSQMHAEVSETDGGYLVRYIGKSGEREVTLFTILYGTKTDDSMPVGTLETNGKTIKVYVELQEISLDDDTINAMQESVNEVLQKLAELPGFKAD